MPSMPVRFWGDDDGSKLSSRLLRLDYPGVWRHGDWITLQPTRQLHHHRSFRRHAQPRRRAGRHREIYRVVEAVDGVDDSLIVHLEDAEGGASRRRSCLFVAVSPMGDSSTRPDRRRIKQALRSNLSPRHVPDESMRCRRSRPRSQRQEAGAAREEDPAGRRPRCGRQPRRVEEPRIPRRRRPSSPNPLTHIRVFPARYRLNECLARARVCCKHSDSPPRAGNTRLRFYATFSRTMAMPWPTPMHIAARP